MDIATQRFVYQNTIKALALVKVAQKDNPEDIQRTLQKISSILEDTEHSMEGSFERRLADCAYQCALVTVHAVLNERNERNSRRSRRQSGNEGASLVSPVRQRADSNLDTAIGGVGTMLRSKGEEQSSEGALADRSNSSTGAAEAGVAAVSSRQHTQTAPSDAVATAIQEGARLSQEGEQRDPTEITDAAAQQLCQFKELNVKPIDLGQHLINSMKKNTKCYESFRLQDVDLNTLVLLEFDVHSGLVAKIIHAFSLDGELADIEGLLEMYWELMSTKDYVVQQVKEAKTEEIKATVDFQYTSANGKQPPSAILHGLDPDKAKLSKKQAREMPDVDSAILRVISQQNGARKKKDTCSNKQRNEHTKFRQPVLNLISIVVRITVALRVANDVTVSDIRNSGCQNNAYEMLDRLADLVPEDKQFESLNVMDLISTVLKPGIGGKLVIDKVSVDPSEVIVLAEFLFDEMEHQHYIQYFKWAESIPACRPYSDYTSEQKAALANANLSPYISKDAVRIKASVRILQSMLLSESFSQVLASRYNGIGSSNIFAFGLFFTPPKSFHRPLPNCGSKIHEVMSHSLHCGCTSDTDSVVEHIIEKANAGAKVTAADTLFVRANVETKQLMRNYLDLMSSV